jgi:hypothetical protein
MAIADNTLSAWFRRRSGARWLALVAMILVCALGVMRIVRHLALPSELQYAPKENTFVVMTSSIEHLWPAIERHFGPAIRDERRDGMMRTIVEGLRSALEEQELKVRAPADLARFGFDITSRVIVSVGGLNLTVAGIDAPAVQFVAIVPVTDAKKAEAFLAQASGRTVSPVPLTDDGGAESVRRYGEADDDADESFYVATPEPDVLLLSNALPQLQRSLLSATTNRQAALENDELYDAVSRAGLIGGAGVIAFWQTRGSPIRGLTMAIHLGNDEINVTADVNLVRGGLRVLDEITRRADVSADWAAALPARTLAASAFQDQSLTRYFELVDSIPVLHSEMQKRWNGLLLDLKAVSGLSRGVIALTGYRDGLPDVALGLWADPDDAARRLDAVRLKLRRDRDVAVLDAALARLPDSPEVQSLLDTGILQPERDRGLTAYRRTGDGWRLPPGENYELADVTYTAVHRGERIRYISPPLSDNDLKLRKEFADADPALIRSDRYRLAAVVLDGVTWIASDADVLRALIDVRQIVPRSSLDKHGLFASALATWDRSDKVQLFVNVDEMAVTSALNPDTDLDFMRTVLLDFQQQPAIAAGLRPTIRPDVMHFAGTLARLGPSN